MKLLTTFYAIVFTVILGGCASMQASPPPAKMTNGMLTNNSGMTPMALG